MSDFLYFKRTKRARGTGWGGYNNVKVWVFDWLIGFAHILDGIITIVSFGFVGSSLAYYIALHKTKFMTPKKV